MKFERIRYPDGQISAKTFESFYEKGRIVRVCERINSYEDLMYVVAINDVLEHNNITNKHLEIPCLFGQRSDRRFHNGQSFDLKLICNIINSCKFKTVTLHDPHSDVASALINNVFIERSLGNIEDIIEELGPRLTFVAPDAGAYKKVFDYAEKLKAELVAAVKHRDLDGKVDLTFIGNVKGKCCLIIDDLCDGGYTFTTLAQKLKDQGAGKVYLYVTHGYFSKGFEELKKNIEHIYCTNSVKDIDDPFVTQFKII